MIVVADTSPLNYLIQIHREHLLETLYDRVLIPSAVQLELANAKSPEIVRQFVAKAPD